MGLFDIFRKKPVTAWDALEASPEFKKQKALFDTMALLCADGVDADKLPNGRGEFGLVATNPIPCKTVFGITAYLGRLRTLNGAKVAYNRSGSVNSDVSPHPIDAYEVLHPAGQKLATLYLSAYQLRNSLNVPRGFGLLHPANNILIKNDAEAKLNSCIPDEKSRAEISFPIPKAANTAAPTPASLSTRSLSNANKTSQTAFEMLRAEAETGSAAAQHLLGLQYLNGAGINKSAMLAERWLAEAASQGYAPAQYTLGMIHWDGRFSERGVWQAGFWLKKAAEQNHREARAILAEVNKELEKPEYRQSSREKDHGHAVEHGKVRPTREDIFSYRRKVGDNAISSDVADLHKGHLGKSFEFSNVGTTTGGANENLFWLGFEAGKECLDAAETRLIRSGRTLSADSFEAEFDLCVVAEAIAEERGLTDVGSEAGMEGLVDGSDPFFDERREAFTNGVIEGIRENVEIGEAENMR